MTVTLAIIITIFAGLPAALLSAAFFWWPFWQANLKRTGIPAREIARWLSLGVASATLWFLIAAVWEGVP